MLLLTFRIDLLYRETFLLFIEFFLFTVLILPRPFQEAFLNVESIVAEMQ